MAKATYHHGNLRVALIEAATEIVAQEGVDAFSLARASRAVGVTHAAAYKHFSDRTALLRAVSDRAMAAFGEALQDAFDRHATPRDQYLATGRAVVAFAASRPHLYQLAFGSLRRDDLETLRSPPSGTVLARFVMMIQEWQAAGWLKPGRPTDWAMVLWASAHGLAHLVATGRIDVTPTEAGALSDTLLGHLHAGIGA